jgi:hypothetical protein
MNVEKNEWGQRKPPQGEARGGWSEGERSQKRLFMEYRNLTFRNPGAPPSYLVDSVSLSKDSQINTSLPAKQ